MEWPQIVTTITEGNAISTVVDAPWVSVTSVNGMTGDVITEPIMENFQTNHYYLKNTIINYDGVLYWAKDTFTSTNVFNVDDWNILDVDSSKVLTGQLQKTSYRRSVIALCQVSTTDNTSLNSYTSGRLAFHRENGLSGAVEINVQAENAYGTAYYFNFDYYSNLNLIDGNADIETATGFRPCTFKYKNVWYGGIEVFIGNAEFGNVTFDGAGNFDIFGLDYYSVVHGTTEASILDQEVYDSLNYTQWTLARSDFYADAFFANSGKLKKTGGYVSTLPSKTGTLAQTSDIGNATLTIQRNGTNVDTFTANASANKTINIAVPTTVLELSDSANYATTAALASKQDTLIAGDHIDITSNTISAVNYVHSEQPIATSEVTPVVTSSMISSGAITAQKLGSGSVTYDKVNWSSMKPVWSTFVFSSDAGMAEQNIVRTTKLGTQLTFRVQNGGTSLYIYSGGETIEFVRQMWASSFAMNTESYGVNGVASGSTVWTYVTGGSSDGTYFNASARSSVVASGVNFTDLAGTIGGSKTFTKADLTLIRNPGTNTWFMSGKMHSAGSVAFVDFQSEMYSMGSGIIPTTYQRGTDESSVTSVRQVIEVLEYV